MRNHAFVPRDYEVFAGLDVDKRSISVTFTDHQGLSRSVRIPYRVEQLLTTRGSTLRAKKSPLRMRRDQRATDCMMGWWPLALPA